ncbi:hypothetical protein COEREDRAFT_42989 [Coemansia reversa NRRL 1564]|uniref:Uncharacterized protein n=1 Tax=Coemansia reversa (strain ATCC 12441 / NRRL 1564) TaxID=763665 RepID=A0A2G5BCJ4_COERN|nr:hypothetical protein COEREDRAFT_42989 [Coemansia reversa NRRL 1564]|eukprot:PIA16437.1 hypothetical protein COEREDRAFT_42989 [Coemansia reversa NRRL 1564]
MDHGVPPTNHPAYPYPQDPSPREIQIVAPPPQFRRFGNAAALGLITFGICTVQESMMKAGMSVGYDHGTRAMTAQSIAVAGIAQFAGGLWQIANGDTFEGAAFTSFGAAWFAKGLAQVPGTGVLDYQENESPELARKQDGIVTLAWGIWVLILLAGNVKSHIANIVLFLTLNLQIDFECAGKWTGDKRITKTGAWFGFFCGLSAMYNAAAILLNEENFWFNLPVGNWYTPNPIADEESEIYTE